MITFTSTPVGGKIVPQIPRKPEENVPQRPLGGLITNPNPLPKSPQQQPLGGLIMPKPPKAPEGDEFVPRPLGGLIAPPKTPKREDLPPMRPKEKEAPSDSKKDKLRKILSFAGAFALATLAVTQGPKLVSKIMSKIHKA